MNLMVYFGILLAAYVCYVAFRKFAFHSAVAASHRREIHDLLTNEKYQVKGRFD